ncbi:MAG: glutamate racemase [Pseudomonadota bacterium]
MTQLSASQPIGIFDSGIGGLTIAQAVVKQLPAENIIYFGDTAHLPYGDKSTAAIQAYSVKIAHMLLQQNCKLILIACNSASTAAYELVKEYIADKAIVMDVIEPVVRFMHTRYPSKHIGLIGTKQTVYSNVYKRKIDALNADIKLTSLATNLLASAIEEFGNHHAIDGLLHEYLSHHTLREVDALLLACTHYPIIKEKIIRYYQDKIEIIDPSDIVAQTVLQRLTEHKLLNPNKSNGTKHFYVSDYTDSFALGTKLFFKEDINLEHYPLWE